MKHASTIRWLGPLVAFLLGKFRPKPEGSKP